MASEKRRFNRFPFNMKAELIVQDTVYEVAEIGNLSMGGCLLEIERVLDPGTECTLRIILTMSDEAPVITVKGKIVRSDQGNIAMKFTSIDIDSLHHLQMIARYNAPDPDKMEQEIKKHPGIL